MTALHSQSTDEDLVAAHVAGDRDAFTALVNRYDRRVYAICLRYFGDPTDAEDATQEAFLALLRRAGSYQGSAAFSTWMYRVATNACNDLARKRARRPRSAGVDVTDLQLAAPEAGTDTETQAVLIAALRELDPEYREPIVLHDLYGVPYQEIADRLGVPVGTVKSRIHRGHSRLAALLPQLRPGNLGPDGSVGAQT